MVRMEQSFNSIKVRLKLNVEYLPYDEDSSFNSIKVRLKHLIIITSVDSKWFQFHKGTIKTIASFALSFILLSFNSIKVRLKPPHLFVYFQPLLSFQFHKGTIKTHQVECAVNLSVVSIP